MGGSVSAGVDNNDLVDNLLAADYIKTPSVERVFRAVDRGMYFTPSGRESAYKDLAWKSGKIHLSAPCIYCEVMENLNLVPGMSFLNLGSGTGYLSTMAGLILGSFGINHGVEIHHDVIDYAQEKLEEFKKTAAAIDEFDFCEPKFVEGNCLLLDSCSIKYDRVYCGAACPPQFENYMKNLIKVGGILVLPLNDRLLKITRVTETVWEKRSVLPVSFANLLEPTTSPAVILPNAEPISLMDACRTTIRAILQAAVDREHPELKIRLPPKVKSKKQRTLRRLFIPMFGESESLTIITGLDHRSRHSEGDSDENMAREEQGSSDATNQDQPSCDDAAGSSSTTSSDEPSNGRNRLQQHSRNSQDQSSDDSDDPSDSSSSSSLTGSYKVQRALFRAMARDIDARNIPFTFTFMRSQANNTLSTLPDYDVASSDSSSVPHDYSSDNSMDIDQPESSGKEKPGAASMKSKDKRAEGTTSKRARNKRKEAEMEESSYACQSSGTVQRPSHASGPSSTCNDEKPLSNEGMAAPSSKKKNGAKREKVDSGIGEDINNWDISSSDVGSEVDFASDSDSEEDTNVVYKSDEKMTILQGRRRLNSTGAVWKGREGDSPAQEPRQAETNNYVMYMRSKIQQLPLPPSIKSYINYFRDM